MLTEAEDDERENHPMGHCVVWVHGVGPLQSGYSARWVTAYDPYLHFHPPTDVYVETYWAGVFPPERDEAAEATVVNALKTVFLTRVTDVMQVMGWSGVWTGLSHLVAQGEATLPDWVINHEATIEEFVTYLVNPVTRAAVKEEVKKQLRLLAGSGKQCSIISHSWGSVVAYESLLDLVGEESGFQCAQLFTLGSPLWLVHYLLQDTSGHKPGNVATWINIHAQGDLIGGGLKPGFQVDQDYAVPSFGNGDPHDSYFVPGNMRVQQQIVANTILRS